MLVTWVLLLNYQVSTEKQAVAEEKPKDTAASVASPKKLRVRQAAAEPPAPAKPAVGRPAGRPAKAVDDIKSNANNASTTRSSSVEVKSSVPANSRRVSASSAKSGSAAATPSAADANEEKKASYCL
jgi:hypothetical protein